MLQYYKEMGIYLTIAGQWSRLNTYTVYSITKERGPSNNYMTTLPLTTDVYTHSS